MRLARKYNSLLKQRLQHYGAWSPVTDSYEVGDFGAFRRGVFQKLGNIKEFGVDPKAQAGSSTANFSFTSSGAVMVRTQGGAEVNAFPDEPVQAQLSIQFSGESSVYIRTGELSVMEMPAVDAAAYALRGKKDPSGRKWKLGWRVVRKVYIADNPAILASSERGVTFKLSGQARALQNLEVGSASADINVTSTTSDVLEIVGGKGPVALDLFKVRITGRAALESFVPGVDEPEPGSESEPEEIGGELDYDWQADPDDDPDELSE